VCTCEVSGESQREYKKNVTKRYLPKKGKFKWGNYRVNEDQGKKNIFEEKKNRSGGKREKGTSQSHEPQVSTSFIYVEFYTWEQSGNEKKAGCGWLCKGEGREGTTHLFNEQGRRGLVKSGKLRGENAHQKRAEKNEGKTNCKPVSKKTDVFGSKHVRRRSKTR